MYIKQKSFGNNRKGILVLGKEVQGQLREGFYKEGKKSKLLPEELVGVTEVKREGRTFKAEKRACTKYSEANNRT